MKPEKVKSRWRRNSEMESSEKSNMSPTTLESFEENTSIKNELMDEELTENVIQQKKLPVYESLDENIYLFEIKRTKRKKEIRRMVCDCTLPKDNETPCGDECLNRLLMIECGSRCVNGDDCSNKRFQKKLYAKTEPFMTARKGWGLKLLEDVSKGSFIIEYVGEVLNLKDFKQRVKQYARKTTNHFYFMALKSDEIIDATNKANLSRFINHSCDPNIETQKWTVNGLLRVGFFAKRDIKAKEELTFDYQFERYGREAQKCYCETNKCNGYIGVSSDITVDLYNNDPKCNKRKKIEERKKEVLEDLMLEKEIERLSIRGLRNKEETLMLARLMVRAEDAHSRETLLDIIMGTTEVACLRLFLDYHGLSLIWSWMAYLNDNKLKTKILKALFLLPVPNRTILLDSKVLNVVEKWASVSSPDSENVFSDPAKRKCDTSDSETDGIYMTENSFNSACEKKPSNEESDLHSSKIVDLRSDDESTDMRFSAEDDSQSKPNLEIVNLAQSLLEKWKLLKVDFRIPRREKQDSNKLEKNSHSLQSSVCRNSNNVSKNSDKHAEKSQNIKEEKDDKDSYFNEEPQEIKVVCNLEENYSSYRKWGEYPHQSKLSKEGKRSLFSMEKDRRNRWKKRNHERGKNISFSNSSHFNGYTDFYSSPVNQTYDSYNVICSNPTNNVIEYSGNHYNSLYMNSNPPRAPLFPNPGAQTNVTVPHSERENTIVCDPSLGAPNVFVPPLVQMPFLPLLPSVPSPSNNFQSNLPLPPPPLQQHIIGVQDNIQLMNCSPIVPGNTSSVSDPLLCGTNYLKNVNDEKTMQMVSTPHVEQPYQAQESNETPKILPSELPPNWKTATDEDGNVYYYHTIDRKSQWEFPKAEESVSADLDNGTPTYDEPEHTHKHATKSRRSHKKHSKRKSTTTAPADTSSNQVHSEIAKKLKELFRTKMSSFVVQCLNPYRKDNCRVGRITTNEDFKHLARKLTHFVMAKELKHCKNVEELDCNENVKHKARDYIHKYMARYGPIYRKEKSISFVDEKYSA